MVAGKYRVVSHLGRGGSATIALALFRSAAGVHKLVVLKCARGGAHGSAREALIEEARLTARMNHQHVVQVYDVAEHEGLPVIVMEHLDGRSLASVMTAARELPELDRSLKLRILAGVLSGLHYAHGLCDLSGRPLHVVHRDVSPHNIVLTCDGQVKLVDFGIAQCGARPGPTTSRRVAGKLGYMAPEQVHGTADRRADVFAAGVVLWELMTLRRFWARATQAEVMRHLLDGHIPRRATLDDDLDDVVASICRRALAPEPDGRYATAGHMQADVERALQAAPASAPEAALGQVVRRIRPSDGLARRHELQQALRELDGVGVSPGAVALDASGHITRARPHGRGERRRFVMLAALLALQLGDVTRKHHDRGTATSPEQAAPTRPQPDTQPTQAPELRDVVRTRSAPQSPVAVADEPAAPPQERAASRQPAATPQHPSTRQQHPPTPRRSTRARPSRATPAQHRSTPVAVAEELVTQLQPGIDLRRLRPAAAALPRAKGGVR
jgi:serine/threonine-protein kinase